MSAAVSSPAVPPAAPSAPGRRRPVRAALLGSIRFYQRAVSPTRPPRCRFVPSCSAYALEAIERHGAARGTWLAVRRLATCAPWHPGGVDLVPEPASSRHPGTTTTARSSFPAAPTADPADGSPSAGPSPLAGLRAGPSAGDLR